MDITNLKSCKCGASNGMSCSRCSRVRLVIMTTHQYKNSLPENMRYNPVFYSRIKMNNWRSLDSIADATFDHLTASTKHHDALSNANIIIAYDNLSKAPIKTFKP